MLSAPDPRLRLLAQILRHVIQRAARFAGRARALPAAKRLKSGPRPGRCALWSVRIAHTGFDAIEKTLGLIWRSIEACRETVVHSIRPRDALVDVFYRPNKNERNEKLTRPQRMVVRRARDRRRDKMSVREIAMVEPLSAFDDVACAAERLDLRSCVFVACDGGSVDNRSHPVHSMRRITDGKLHGQPVQRRNEIREHRVLDENARARRAFLSRESERGTHDARGSVFEIGMARNYR